MNPEQAKRLGAYLKEKREAKGLSARGLAAATNIDNGTIVRIEQGFIANPAPDKLAAIAEALGLTLADVYGLADYSVPSELPSFTPYLRTKYRDLPDAAVADMEKYFDKLANKYGVDPAGPAPGEDET